MKASYGNIGGFDDPADKAIYKEKQQPLIPCIQVHKHNPSLEISCWIYHKRFCRFLQPLLALIASASRIMMFRIWTPVRINKGVFIMGYHLLKYSIYLASSFAVISFFDLYPLAAGALFVSFYFLKDNRPF
jgi:hypothetical protein